MWSCRNEQFTSFGIAVVDHRQCDRDVPIQRPPLAKRLYVDWHRRAFAGLGVVAKRNCTGADRVGRSDVRATLAGDISGEMGEASVRLICFARKTIYVY